MTLMVAACENRHSCHMPGLEELGWLQFERLCELVLEADAGVDPTRWEGSADVSRQLASIAAPTLIIWGDQETIVSRADQETLANGIPGARLVIYNGHGHAPHWEDPARIAADLAQFVEPAAVRAHAH